MKSKNFIYRLISVLLFIILAIGLQAQKTKTDSGFVPEVGQEGKDVVWVPTPQALVDTMLSMAKVTPADFVIDLGSGDGRTVITAAKRGASARGIEFNPDMVALSRQNAVKEGVTGKVEFVEGDLFETDLSKATVITMFLLPQINMKLRPRLLDLKPGTRIVSNTFRMEDWEPDYEVVIDNDMSSWNTALMWIIPAKVQGTWKLGMNNLSLSQEFQMVLGTVTINGKKFSVTDGRLDGSEITFKIGEALYLGHVDGNRMSGTVTTGSTKENWTATKSVN